MGKLIRGQGNEFGCERCIAPYCYSFFFYAISENPGLSAGRRNYSHDGSTTKSSLLTVAYAMAMKFSGVRYPRAFRLAA